MKRHLVTILLVFILLIGLGLISYPTVADYWNNMHATRAIANYTEAVSNIDNEKYEQMWHEAEAYNQDLAKTGVNWNPDQAMLERYNSLLDVSGSGIMGYIEIPDINVALPIYHGTEDTVLQIAVGHIAGSSLPVGGETSHCILSGHTGLSSARLFTDLDKLKNGDTFLLHTLDETLTYEIDQIHIVWPYELSDLTLEEGKDYVTLVTCTPYGVNDHRLLVRGKRVATEEGPLSIRVTGDALIYDPLMVAPIVAVPILLVLLVAFLISTGKRSSARKKGAIS